jgi:hypothetical protein
MEAATCWLPPANPCANVPFPTSTDIQVVPDLPPAIGNHLTFCKMPQSGRSMVESMSSSRLLPRCYRVKSCWPCRYPPLRNVEFHCDPASGLRCWRDPLLSFESCHSNTSKNPGCVLSQFNGIMGTISIGLLPLGLHAQPPIHFSRQSPQQAPFLHNLQRLSNMGLPWLCTPRYRRQAIYRGWEHMEAVASC